MSQTSVEQRAPRSEMLFGDEGLLNLDRTLSHVRLSREIREARTYGYAVNIGEYRDPAYNEPSEIHSMYKKLEGHDDQLEAARSGIVDRLMAGVLLKKLFKPNPRDVYQLLEYTRDKLMFGANESDSRPWHMMRGRALALETIVMAPRLRAVGETEGEFVTMAGELDGSLLEYTFDGRARDLNGLNLHAATARAERDFFGRSPEDAEARTMKRFDETRQFLRAPVSKKFKDIVVNCTDSLGIRSRGEEVQGSISNHLSDRIEAFKNPDREIIMMSFGCGTARSILNVAAEMKDLGVSSKIILLDQDPIALAAALKIADKLGVGDMVEVHCKRLFDKFGKPLDLDKVLEGRELDVAEDSGLREYLPDAVYTNIAKQTWQHLASGGIASTGNMNVNRPQRRFLHGMMGWFPAVKMRTISQNLKLLSHADIPPQCTRVTVTQDGVYSLFSSIKP